MKRRNLILTLVLIFSGVQFSNSQDRKNEKYNLITSMQSITAAECFEYDSFLASEECQGRAPCSEGFDKAAAYVAAHFREIGLMPLMKGSSYFQFFHVDRNRILDGNEFSLELLIKSPHGKDSLEISYQLEDDFLPAGISAPCDINTNVVFAGYGITSEENNWDDYKKLDVKNKAVIILGGTPPIKDADFGSMYRINMKAEMAEKAGALALLVVGKPIGTISTYQSLPVVTISKRVADDLLKGSGKNIDVLKKDIKEKQKSKSFEIKHNVRIKVNSKLTSDCLTMNILGYIEGSDPDLKDEFIVIGAHVDHLGQIEDHIFYGANDNASGTSVVMEVAEAFSLMEEAPKRSILFIAFTGEEMGLIGSSYFVENSPVPVSKIKAMVNMDMVGSGDDAIMVVGGHTFPEFAQLFDTLSKQYIQVLIKRRWTSANSDHYPFHNAGIPSVFLYAMSGVPTYHSSADKPETLESEVMERVGRLVFLTTLEIANSERIEFRYVEKD